MESDSFTQILEMCTDIEHLLEQNFNATGEGLHELVESVHDKLPGEIRHRILYLGAIRHKAMQENIEYATTKIDKCRERYRKIRPFLSRQKKEKKAWQTYWPYAIILLLVFIVIMILIIR